ncbi:metal-dependent hydrolase [Sporomusa aerivorans]|uniref:metal-dependent hydrolase n=1 Tax=Sporomusa aerivorans TaxID=204936 RepID=UPI00352A49E4
MDTLSHALVGIAIAGLSGHPLTVSDPIYLASILGAQAPDLDIIASVRGKFALLRQHRSFSHSLPGLVLWSSLITAAFSLAVPAVMLKEIFIWSFLGGLSHIIVDFFNAHGAAVLWPLCRERRSFSLLNVFDPFLLTIMIIVLVLGLPARETSLLFFGLTSLYVFMRYRLKIRATGWLKQYFSGSMLRRILVMPSLKSLFCWDFVIETMDTYHVGHIGALNQALTVHTELAKQPLSTVAQGAQKTVLGEFFTAFTPFSYFVEYQAADQQDKFVRIYDLRYFFNQSFLHSATIIFGTDQQPRESYINTQGHTIKIPC